MPSEAGVTGPTYMHYVIDLQLSPYGNVLKALQRKVEKPDRILSSMDKCLLNATQACKHSVGRYALWARARGLPHPLRGQQIEGCRGHRKKPTNTQVFNLNEIRIKPSARAESPRICRRNRLKNGV